ncbi:MAG: hypothetical protein EOO03_01790 [Chitinophagaceae bacterium]|nr:MAG: hypothetical protein EOO03_01790 [Chitinophagaceae bacterium]
MMIRPSNNKTLIVIIVALLAVNFTGLALFFSKTPASKKTSAAEQRKNAMRQYLKNECGFSAAQLVQYDTLAEQHRRNMQPYFDQLKSEKEQRIKTLAKLQFADSAIVLAVQNTIAKQQEVETGMLMHLKDVRNLCNPQQLVKFDSSLHNMFARRAEMKKRN